jgi:hypothetical protein
MVKIALTCVFKNMPIQTVIKNGRKYYRWGKHGTLYIKKSKAEEQGRAAYANGYKEKSK